MEEKTKIPLTAAEMSGLWTQYINDSLAVCVNSYFLEKVEDEEVRPIIEFTLNTAKENLSIMQEIFQKDNFPVPIGFTGQDVNPQAPKLFSDTFVLMYLRNMSILAMQASGGVLGLATRSDITSFHKKVLNAGVTLQELTRDLMLKQGTYIKPPYISTPQKAEYVKKQHFLAGFFGHDRSLTSIEISHLFFNIKTNVIGRALITGFAQIAQNGEVKQYFVRGKQIAQNHMEVLSKYLTSEDLPVPMTSDSMVTSSTEKVFSDKLMMFHISAMNAAGIGNYAMAMGASQRRDIGEKYAFFIPEISTYAVDGAKIMINNGWFEKPPQSDDRYKIIRN